MVNEEQTPGKLLDEYLSLNEDNLEELRVRITTLEKECKELRYLINQSIANQKDFRNANLSDISQEKVMTSPPTETSKLLSEEDNSSQDHEIGVSGMQTADMSFYACPIIQGDDINLIDIGDNASDALFVVRYNGDEGVVSYNYDNKLSLLNNVEVELLKYVSCIMETSGIPSTIEMISTGSAYCVGGTWKIKDKVKIKIF